MLYQTVLNPDLSSAYTQVMFNYLKALETNNADFGIRVYGSVLNWAFAPEWAESLSTYFPQTDPDTKVVLNHFQIGDLAKAPCPREGVAIGLTAFETTSLPSWIIDSLNKNLKGVIVPSQQNKEVLEKNGLLIPAFVVEHALCPLWTADLPRQKAAKPPHVFGYVGAWNARKNPIKIVEAYLKAFPKNTGATALLLKTYAPSGIEGQIDHLVSKLSEDSSREDIWLYNELWDEAQMGWAYGQIDTYVSAHKGEGFGLGLAQAAAQGIPVIYTNYSAPCEWLPESEGHIPVPCEIVDVSGASDAYNLHFAALEGDKLQWAQISEDNLIEALKKRSRVFSKSTPKHVLEIRHQLSWEHIGKKLISAVESITGKPMKRIPHDRENRS